MITSNLILRSTIMACAVAATFVSVSAQSNRQPSFAIARASLDGFQEAPSAIFTTGTGSAVLVRRRNVIEYTLRYNDLQGDVTVAAGVHIHFGRPALTGGIAAFLCEGAGLAAPVGTPACVDDGAGNGVVRGTILPEDVLAIEAQGFPAGNLDDLWAIISEGASYINLHTDAFPAGEIRADIPGPRRRRR